MAWKKNSMWLNGKSYITGDELFGEYKHFINKLGEVLYSDEYAEDTKMFCRSVLDFAVDENFITWKQANAIMKIKTTEERLLLYHKYPNSKRYIYCQSNMTHKEIDRISELIFGTSVTEEEMEGYVKDYDKKGNRVFLLPTEKDMHLCDHI